MARGTRDWGLTLGGLQSVAEFDSYLVIVSVGVPDASDKYAVSLFNPAGSGKVATVHSISAVISASTNTTRFNFGDTYVHRTTSLGSGGSLNLQRPLDPDSPASAMQCRTNLTGPPVLAAQLAQISWVLKEDVTAGAGRVAPLVLPFDLYRYPPGSSAIPLRIREGGGITVWSADQQLGHNISVLLEYSEAPA